jgi:hypothetical protein
MEEVYERDKRKKLGAEYDVGEVGWYEHIWPLLQRPPLLSWCNGQANGGHGKFDEGVFSVSYRLISGIIQDPPQLEISSMRSGKRFYPIQAVTANLYARLSLGGCAFRRQTRNMIKLELVKHFCTLCLGSQATMVHSLHPFRYSSTHLSFSFHRQDYSW